MILPLPDEPVAPVLDRIDAYLGPNRQPGTDPAQYTSEAYRARNCPPDVMLDTLDYLDDRHGGVEGYVKSVGVTDEQIATLLDALLTLGRGD